jgi:hypothetical protein
VHRWWIFSGELRWEELLISVAGATISVNKVKGRHPAISVDVSLSLFFLADRGGEEEEEEGDIEKYSRFAGWWRSSAALLHLRGADQSSA